MGYTIYWEVNTIIPQDVFDSIRLEVDGKLDNKLLDMYQNTQHELVFDDPDDMGETFVFTKKKGFNFCKTNRAPYTKNVIIALEIAKKHLGSRLDLASDGEVEIEGRYWNAD